MNGLNLYNTERERDKDGALLEKGKRGRQLLLLVGFHDRHVDVEKQTGTNIMNYRKY